MGMLFLKLPAGAANRNALLTSVNAIVVDTGIFTYASGRPWECLARSIDAIYRDEAGAEWWCPGNGSPEITAERASRFIAAFRDAVPDTDIQYEDLPPMGWTRLEEQAE